jgi:hypothetical protein
MGLLTQAATDLAGIFTATDFGQAITYTPASGTPFATVGIVSQIDLDRIASGSRGVVCDYCECRITQAALTAGSVSAPTIRMERQTGDKITVSGDIWEVIDANKSQAGYWVLVLERNIRIVP